MLTISRTRLLTGAAALALTASLGATPGLADSHTGTMQVSASIAQDCRMGTVNDLNFGDIVPGDDETADTTFVVTCSFPGDVTVEIGPGTGNGGSLPRRMTDGDSGEQITYTLWQSSAQSNDWNGPQNFALAAGDNTLNVHGFIDDAASATKSVGTYTDTLTITVTF